MLKIKDEVPLKELEKFDFDDYGVGYKRFGGLGEQYFILNADRKIRRIHPYSLREEASEDEVFDLIQAGLVEKVEE